MFLRHSETEDNSASFETKFIILGQKLNMIEQFKEYKMPF